MASDGEFELRDQCVVPWADGTYYNGKVIKILDAATSCLIEDVSTWSKKPRQSTLTFPALRRSKSKRVPDELLDECERLGKNFYYVHFLGWRADTDEWLEPGRMLPATPANIALMQETNDRIKKERERAKLEEKARKPMSPKPEPGKRLHWKQKRKLEQSGLDGGNGSSASSPEPKREEGATAAADADHGPRAKRPAKRAKVALGPTLVDARVNFPLSLKRLLVLDWQLITQDCLLVQLPRAVSVVQILREFREHQLTIESTREEQIRHELGGSRVRGIEDRSIRGDTENVQMFTDSMTTYFDYALGFLLLYRYERNQYYYQLQSDPNLKPSLVYGGEHLLRLIVSMPALLTQDVVMDDITLQYVVKQLNLLVEFIADHQHRFLGSTETYESPTRYYESISSSMNDDHLQQQRNGEDASTTEAASGA